jgi:hypothetical protein
LAPIGNISVSKGLKSVAEGTAFVIIAVMLGDKRSAIERIAVI